jgi:hypothetical protein
MQVSADSNKMPSIFQLIVGSKQTYEMKLQQDLINFSLSKTISIARPSAQTHLVNRIFETSNEFNQWLIVTFIKTNNDISSSSSEGERHDFSSSKSNSQSAPNSLFERYDKFIVVSKLRAPDKSLSNNDFRLVVNYYLIPCFEGEYIYLLDLEGAQAALNHSDSSKLSQLVVDLILIMSSEGARAVPVTFCNGSSKLIVASKPAGQSFGEKLIDQIGIKQAASTAFFDNLFQLIVESILIQNDLINRIFKGARVRQIIFCGYIRKRQNTSLANHIL